VPEISFREPADARHLPGADVDAPYLQHPGLYATWSRLGYPEWFERLVSRTLHGFTRGDRGVTHDPVYPEGAVILGPGWSHRYPQDRCRWALWPDARLLLTASEAATTLYVDFDPEYWQAAPFPAVEVFCDGRFTGTSTKVADSFRFPLPTAVRKERQLEVSLRAGGGARFVAPGAMASWFRLLAPVRSIKAQ
jgi:hypothetical protein